jgi:uncharacterized membrane-anchored protein YitT (DUF2179 family)
MKKLDTRRKILDMFAVVCGSILYSLVVQLFVLPVDLLTGGATGIAIALHGIYGWAVSTVLLVANIILLLMGLIFLGRKFAMTTLLSSLLIPLSLGVFERVYAGVVLTHDIMLNTLFASFGIGASVGIVLRAGSSTGGTDIPPLILQKYFNIPAAIGVWVLDSIILLAQGIVYDPERILYGLLIVILSSIVMDRTMQLGSSRTELKIISKKTEDIKRAIIEQIDRGVTLLDGETGFKEEETQIILSVIKNRELPRTERLIHEIDPEAFIIVNRITEVKGNGFTYEKPGE